MSKRSRKSLHFYNTYAIKHRGVCLSTELGPTVTFRCERGHEWETTGNHTNRDQWCVQCNRRSVSDIHEQCAKRGLQGTCVNADTYRNSASALQFKCTIDETHPVWELTWTQLTKRKDVACPRCTHFARFKELFQDYAERHEGKCLTDPITFVFPVNMRAERNITVTMQCKAGKTWNITCAAVVSDKDGWCGQCRSGTPHHVWEVDALMHSRNPYVVRLSPDDVYQSTTTMIQYRCGNEHVYETSYQILKLSILHGCAECAGNKPATRDDIIQRAADKGGVCLNIAEYVNSTTANMRFRCAAGHEWTSSYGSVLTSWCPHQECSGYRNTVYAIEDCQLTAAGKGGRCLDTKYVNAHTPMQWQCAKGHTWPATYSCVRTRTWCPKPTCGGSERHTIEFVEGFGFSRGFQLLSTEYHNNDAKLLWKCENDHEWRASFGAIYNSGTGCPICNKKLKNEQKTREIMERLFGCTFPPYNDLQILRNPTTGRLLQLDGYNEQKRVAFEYHGPQHYKFVKLYHQNNIQHFENLKARDVLKLRLCDENQLSLIVVPYTCKTDAQKEAHIRVECVRLGIEIPN